MKRTLRQLWQVAKTPFRIAAGALLTLVGLLGLLLPILPGWIFIFPGLARLDPMGRPGEVGPVTLSTSPVYLVGPPGKAKAVLDSLRPSGL